jgi:hypothetical protein
MCRRLVIGLFCVLCLIPRAHRAHAMQFEQVQISPTDIIIGGRGQVISGDKGRFDQTLAAIPPGHQVVALAVDSPGGNVEEAKLLAAAVHARRLTVVIPHNSKCASACFLLLVASPHRLAASDALVGVHSASEDGAETDLAWIVTRQMARDSAALGIPPAIIGKMVATTPGRVEWLTTADLMQMNVTIFDGDLRTAMRQASPAYPAVAPATPAASRFAPPGFPQGRDDRRAWEAWLGPLKGPFREGAEYALTQIVLTQPGSCLGANGVSRGDFTQGCAAAWQKLSAVVPMLRSNADYAAGWNSTGKPVDSQVAVTEPVEATYQGAYFCGPSIGRLTVMLFQYQNGSTRRTLLSFGPEATSQRVPQGAFNAEGRFDPQSRLALQPTRWVQQPVGYGWFGLDGASDDGGRTFSGRVTDNPFCTTFTLKRSAGATAAK